jgi:hypothetical protein
MQILCDFYNLNLECGRTYRPPRDGEEFIEKRGFIQHGFRFVIDSESYPTPDERERIENFFREHAPNILDVPGSFPKKHLYMDKFFDDTFFTLGMYEYEKKRSWFESSDCLDFADYWQHIAGLMNSLVKGELHLYYFSWFQHNALRWKDSGLGRVPHEQIEGYRLNVRLVDPQGNARRPPEVMAQTLTVPLDSWRVIDSYAHNPIRFGLFIGAMLFTLHEAVIQALRDPSVLKRCAGCENIFQVSQNRRKYCSEECRVKYKRTRDNERQAQERAEHYQELAGRLSQLPKGEPFDATQIATQLNKIAEKRLGYTGHQIGRFLGIGALKAELEKHGVSYDRQKTDRQSLYTFRKILS